MTFRHRRFTIISLAFLMTAGLAQDARGDLVFRLDFDQGGTCEDAWPLKGGQVSVDVYVSNVPEPGLFSMGFFIQFDEGVIGVVGGGATAVDGENWPINSPPDTNTDGQVGMLGSREPFQTGLAGNGIRLATITFKSQNLGVSELRLLGCEEPQNCLVLDDDEGTVLDSQIPPEGVVLARIHPGYPGDVNGDGVVQLADAILALQALLGLKEPFVSYTADLNGNGKIDAAEAAFVLQVVAALKN